MSNKDELERLRRLRERQIASRNPHKKLLKHDEKVRGKFAKKSESWKEILAVIPTTWWGMIIGGIVGFILALVFHLVLKVKPLKLEAFWVEYLWYTLILLGVAIGRMLGAALDWQDDHEKTVVRGRR
ncbi:MAG: hypothetical protein JW934_16180 [Anaerolineae bacterium]|nr:hypothetical protein [Anaerolineae bacterium]